MTLKLVCDIRGVVNITETCNYNKMILKDIKPEYLLKCCMNCTHSKLKVI